MGLLKMNIVGDQEDSEPVLIVANGQVKIEFDLAVGADGVWSRARPFLNRTILRRR